MYTILLNGYKSGAISDAMLDAAVAKNWITLEQETAIKASKTT